MWDLNKECAAYHLVLKESKEVNDTENVYCWSPYQNVGLQASR